MSRLRLSPLGAVLWLSLLGFTTVRAATPPASLVELASRIPGNVDLVAYLRPDPELSDWIFSLPPLARHRERYQAQSREVQERYGFQPLEDIRGIAMVFSHTGTGSQERHQLFFLDVDRDPRKLAEAIAADPAVRRDLSFDGPHQFRYQDQLVRFRKDGILFGTRWTVEGLAEHGKRGTSPLPEVAGEGVDDDYRVMLAWGREGARRRSSWRLPKLLRNPFRKKSAADPEKAREARSQVDFGAVSVEGEDLRVRLLFRTEEAAEVVHAVLREKVEAFRQGQGTEGFDRERTGEGLSPARFLQIMGEDWLRQLAGGLRTEVDREALTVHLTGFLSQAPLPLPSEESLGGLAAWGVGNLLAFQAKAESLGCFTIQRVLELGIANYQRRYGVAVEELDEEVLRKIAAGARGGRLPTDPGQGPGSWRNYSLEDGRVRCRVHGSAADFGFPVPGKGRERTRPLGALSRGDPPPPQAPSPGASEERGAEPERPSRRKRLARAVAGAWEMLKKGGNALWNAWKRYRARRNATRARASAPVRSRDTGPVSDRGEAPGRRRTRSPESAPSHGPAPAQAPDPRRLCLVRQKQLAGALEMNLLYDGPEISLREEASLAQLVAAGYLVEVPRCPEQVTGGPGNFYRTPAFRSGLACRIHGGAGEVVGAR